MNDRPVRAPTTENVAGGDGERRRPARFLADVSLELVARRLRVLGYDVRTMPGARLEMLLEAARAEARVVLTPAARRPRAFADVLIVTVPRDDPAAAVRTVAGAFEPSGPPFSRCTICGSALVSRTLEGASGDVPVRVIASARALAHCAACAKWYWDGSHVARLREWLREALGHDVPGPAPLAE